MAVGVWEHGQRCETARFSREGKCEPKPWAALVVPHSGEPNACWVAQTELCPEVPRLRFHPQTGPVQESANKYINKYNKLMPLSLSQNQFKKLESHKPGKEGG